MVEIFIMFLQMLIEKRINLKRCLHGNIFSFFELYFNLFHQIMLQNRPWLQAWCCCGIIYDARRKHLGSEWKPAGTEDRTKPELFQEVQNILYPSSCYCCMTQCSPTTAPCNLCISEHKARNFNCWQGEKRVKKRTRREEVGCKGEGETRKETGKEHGAKMAQLDNKMNKL